MRSQYFLFLPLLFCILVAGVHAELTVHVIDVGQGDAHILQSSGHFMLIDAGPESAGNKVVSYLEKFGVQILDYVIATNPGEEHIGGMKEVLNTIKVGMYIDGGNPNPDAVYETTMQRLAADQTVYSNETEGRTFLFGDATVEFINTPGQAVNGNTALKVTDGAITWLFPGDDGTVAVPATILSLAEHGSPGSNASIDVINPRMVVIGVDANSTPDLPDKNVLEGLKKSGIFVNRTDLNGNIVITSDGSTYTVTPEKNTTEQPVASRTGRITPVPTRTKTIIPVSNRTEPGIASTGQNTIDWKKIGEKFTDRDREEIKGFINGSIPFASIDWDKYGEKFSASELKELENYGKVLLNASSVNLSSLEGSFNASTFSGFNQSGGVSIPWNSSFIKTIQPTTQAPTSLLNNA